MDTRETGNQNETPETGAPWVPCLRSLSLEPKYRMRENFYPERGRVLTELRTSFERSRILCGRGEETWLRVGQEPGTGEPGREKLFSETRTPGSRSLGQTKQTVVSRPTFLDEYGQVPLTGRDFTLLSVVQGIGGVLRCPEPRHLSSFRPWSTDPPFTHSSF